MKLNKKYLVIVTSFAGILFQANLSYLMTIYSGNFYWYLLFVMALSIVSMGIGSLLTDKISQKTEMLFKVERINSFLVWFVPIYILSLQFILFENKILVGILFLLVTFFGVLSGMEVPLSLSLSENQPNEDYYKLLELDFKAMAVGMLIFSLIILPFAGVLATIITQFILYSYVKIIINRKLALISEIKNNIEIVGAFIAGISIWIWLV